jgi:hypothetical protein
MESMATFVLRLCRLQHRANSNHASVRSAIKETFAVRLDDTILLCDACPMIALACKAAFVSASWFNWFGEALLHIHQD